MSDTFTLELSSCGVKPGTFRETGPNGEPDFYKDDGEGCLLDPSGRVVGFIDYAAGEYGYFGVDQELQAAIAPDGKVSFHDRPASHPE